MHRAKGIIIQKRDLLREAEDIILYSLEFGKISLVSRGGKKMAAKLTPHLQLFNVVEVEFVQGKYFKIVTSVYIADYLKEIKGDLVKLKIASEVLKFLDTMLIESQSDRELWNFVSLFLDETKQRELRTHDINKLIYYFKINILHILGFWSARRRIHARTTPLPDSVILGADFTSVLANTLEDKEVSHLMLSIDSFAKGIY